jgi:flagellar biosynthesis protein FlhG
MKRRRLGRGLRDLAAPFEAGVPAGRDARASSSPADMLREVELTSREAPRARMPGPLVICVTSGKGGTGKSILTSNLAVHLAASGVGVMAVDVDMGLANLHLLLGMRPEKTVLEVIERGASLDDIAEIGPVGLRLAAGGSGLPEMADLNAPRLRRLVAAMDRVNGRTEAVLVDTGAGIGRATTAFLQTLSEIIVVTTPDLTAMTDAYAVIKNVALNNRTARISLVVNRAASPVEALEIYGRMERISRKFLERSILYLGHVLEDPRVPASVAARIPILLYQPAAPAAACIRAIGRSLILNARRHASLRRESRDSRER